MDPWFSFAIVIAAQFLLFIAVVKLYERKRIDWPLVAKCLLVGLIFGICFDLCFGYYLGMYTYELGFTLHFLVFNGLLSWGFWIAKVAHLEQLSFTNFYLTVTPIALCYEVVNYFFPVWRWTFLDSAMAEYVLVILVAYAGLTLPIVTVLSLLGIQRFAFLRVRISKFDIFNI